MVSTDRLPWKATNLCLRLLRALNYLLYLLQLLALLGIELVSIT